MQAIAPHAPQAPKEVPIDAKDLALTIADLLDAKKAEDIRIIDVGDRLKVADYFLVCTGLSRAHVRALYDEIHIRLKSLGERHTPVQGADLGWWVVVDYSDVVVHILQPDARAYYDLDRLYDECPRLDWAPPEDPLARARPATTADERQGA
jgi:ribosome-associated protein